MIGAETPEGMSYKTPKAIVDSPSAKSDGEDPEVEIIEISDDDGEDPEVEIIEVSDDDGEDPEVEIIDISDDDIDDGEDDPTDARPRGGSKLALMWHGYSRTDLQEMWRAALRCRDDGRIDEAEDMFKEVWLGLRHVLGKTNDTVRAAYNLADLYAHSNRTKEANGVLENVLEDHIYVRGYEDKRTQQNILHAVEFLNGWNRQADALGLLSLSKELLQSSRCSCNNQRADGQAGRKRKAAETANPNSSRSDLSWVIQCVNEDLSSDNIEYGLGVARTYVAAKDEAAEALLIAIQNQCENHPDLGTQHLKAQAELVNLYDKMGQSHRHQAKFEDALESANKAWVAYKWEEDEIESLDFMEAVLQLFANLLKCGYHWQAKLMFRKASEKASVVFGSDDERTVWILITIGLVYQTHMTWIDAEEWFEQAFAVALANKEWGPKDGIVRSLQNAIDHHPFFICFR